MEANCRPQVPLPNPFEETFLLWTGFFTKLGPQIRFPPVPNFGVNNFTMNDYMNKITTGILPQS
jgi:hypothetical protein